MMLVDAFNHSKNELKTSLDIKGWSRQMQKLRVRSQRAASYFLYLTSSAILNPVLKSIRESCYNYLESEYEAGRIGKGEDGMVRTEADPVLGITLTRVERAAYEYNEEDPRLKAIEAQIAELAKLEAEIKQDQRTSGMAKKIVAGVYWKAKG